MTNTLKAIAALTSALIGQDAALGDTATARKALIAQAVADGETLTAIGNAAGISRQRIAKLLKDETGAWDDKVVTWVLIVAGLILLGQFLRWIAEGTAGL